MVQSGVRQYNVTSLINNWFEHRDENIDQELISIVSKSEKTLILQKLEIKEPKFTINKNYTLENQKFPKTKEEITEKTQALPKTEKHR